MKLATDLFQEVIEIEEGRVVSLVLENKDIFREFLENMYEQIEGKGESFTLSNDNSLLKVSKTVEMLTTYVPFEMNEKRLLTKLVGVIEHEMLNEKYFNQTMNLLARIEKYMDDVTETLPYPLYCDGISANSLVKMCGISIEDKSNRTIEKLIDYMNIVRDLLGEKLFILANMRLFFDDIDVQGFVDTANVHKYHVLLVDSINGNSIYGTKKLIVDNDLCLIDG